MWAGQAELMPLFAVARASAVVRWTTVFHHAATVASPSSIHSSSFILILSQLKCSPWLTSSLPQEQLLLTSSPRTVRRRL